MIDEQDLRKARETLVAKQKELKKAGKRKQLKSGRRSEWRRGRYSLQQKTFGSFVSGALRVWTTPSTLAWEDAKSIERYEEWGNIQLKTSADGVEFLEYTERQIKTRTGAGPKDIRAVKPKIFSVPGSDRDPVQALSPVCF